VTGQFQRDLVAPALLGGLVLIVLLIGFTVIQHAFAGGAISQGLVSDTERRALALSGSGDLVFDWDVSSDKIFVSPQIETCSACPRGARRAGAGSSTCMSPTATATASRSTPCWSSVAASSNLDLRLRAGNGAYHWFNVKARPVIGSDGEVIRVIGTLADVTEQRTAQERLLHDAVHDNLTGLPNRKLFQDRLGAVFGFTAPTTISARPSRHRCRPLQAGQQIRRLLGRRFDPADAGAPPRPAAAGAGHAGPSAATSSR
jgi:hypothetical protein